MAQQHQLKWRPLEFHHAKAQRTQRAINNEKARFLFHVYFYYENKKKHIEDAKLGNNASFSASFAPLRYDF